MQTGEVLAGRETRLVQSKQRLVFQTQKEYRSSMGNGSKASRDDPKEEGEGFGSDTLRVGQNSKTAVSEGGGEREPTESEAKESVGTRGVQTSITE
jgi:hypothetical protein